MAPSRSQLINTANAFIEAYNQWTVSSVLSIRSPSCTHRILPGNRPARTRAEFGEFLERTIPVIRNFRLHAVDTSPWIVDVEARRVTMHLKSTGESDIGAYNNEYIFIITISEDGEKVDGIIEFLDSLYSSEFVGSLAKQTGQALG
ncbi:Isomerase trt14 [Trichoderma lentiforme]|uniref:Isomerase trt14 n=1 Tax=Trichoderma lentiforme TaxID=1567552 RepID=A0A9P5C9R4_9HYPO|nr:Isomerase trt14 [Trichoderma lentiforme]